MNPRTDILNELKELNSTLQDSPANPYAVPAGYFEGIADAVLAKIKGDTASSEIAELSPLLAGLSRKMPYEVPKGFFEATDLSSITSDEELPQVLAGLHRTLPYKVPQGYFETLPQIMLGRVAKPKARVVSMTKWMRVAAAAVIATAILISGYLYFSTPKSISVDNPQWVAKNLKDLDTKELEQFIQETDVTVAQAEKPKMAPGKKAEVKTLLNDVSTEELESFLEAVPVEDDEMILLN